MTAAEKRHFQWESQKKKILIFTKKENKWLILLKINWVKIDWTEKKEQKKKEKGTNQKQNEIS